ncbi:MAG: DNA polymerase III subunit gamma/tau [Hyphomonadaceae bacterium]|jgi:DNA polymerase-3 subunit gamma/tau|nr:DNA polymerase III subunit gamma/tau [Hyphomonadaceae bacterium]
MSDWTDDPDLDDDEPAERDDLTADMFGDPQPAPPKPAQAATGGAYLVLARKYRPQRFEDMIGQEAMVQTLANAFSSGRIAHAYMLTGVRGVGKTTTARLLARALNYKGATHDAPSVTLDPMGVHCADIMAGRHPDVFELDAASRTGVDAMRELLEGVRYGPIAARYKVYIIDEVHMLSTGAFNALLKTLEEPPPHAKFIFATTEIRKVPVTILSRCQRFDLRRVSVEALSANLTDICGKEGINVDPDGIAMIARAAEGSVRDAQSLLDQAIVHDTGAGVDAATVRDMLGLADRTRTTDLFAAMAGGDAAGVLTQLDEQRARGAQPDLVLRDVLDLAHEVARLQALGKAWRPAGPAEQTGKLRAIADSLTAGAINRGWQVLVKGHAEALSAPDVGQAVEMCLLRATASFMLPGPEDLARMVAGAVVPAATSGGASTAAPTSGGAGARGYIANNATALADAPDVTAMLAWRPAGAVSSGAVPAAAQRIEPAEVLVPPPAVEARPETFEALIAQLEESGARAVASLLERHARPVRLKGRVLTLWLEPTSPADLQMKTLKALNGLAGEPWQLELASSPPDGVETIHEARTRKTAEATAAVLQLDPVQALLTAFPGAQLVEVRDPPAASTVVQVDFSRGRGSD